VIFLPNFARPRRQNPKPIMEAKLKSVRVEEMISANANEDVRIQAVTIIIKRTVFNFNLLA